MAILSKFLPKKRSIKNGTDFDTDNGTGSRLAKALKKSGSSKKTVRKLLEYSVLLI